MKKQNHNFITILWAAFLLFLITIMPLSVHSTEIASSPIAETATQAESAPKTKLIVYYFHRTARCYSCNRIEQLTKETVQESFGPELADGSLEWKVFNVEEPENTHFIREYRLYTQSVVLSDVKNGKEEGWKNLQRVWELVRNDQKFKEYIQQEIRSYLDRGEKQ